MTVAGGRRGDRPAGRQPAGERHQVDVRVLGQRRADLGARAQHQVRDAGRQARLGQQLHEQDRRVRRQLAGLEDERVARGQRRCDLPHGLQQRVVPRRDQPADADRLVHDAAEGVRVAGVDDAAGVLRRELAEVAQAGGDVGHVVAALDQALAGVERLGAGERLGVAVEQLRGAQQQVTAQVRGRAGPRAGVERPPRRGDGGLGVLGGALGDRRHQGAVGGAADLPSCASCRLDPFATDEEVRHADHSHGHTA